MEETGAAVAGPRPDYAPLIFGCAGTVLLPDEAAFYRAAQPLGFILFARNVENPDQLRALTGALREAVGRAAPVLVDQEGGRVQRLRAPHWREWLPPLDQVRNSPTGRRDRLLWLRYRLIAAELRGVGIDANCAPSADIARPDTHAFLRNRCLGETAETVAPAARAAAQGLIDGGVLPIIKHIPGHGRARIDSHLSLPVVEAGTEELFDTDFQPFATLADLPAAMTAHVLYPAFDALNPATTSAATIAAIRDGIGFGGLLLSDDLSMQALSGTVTERALQALAAGCDIALHCNGKLDEMAAIAASAPATGPETAARVAAALTHCAPSATIDTAALAAEFEALFRDAGNG